VVTQDFLHASLHLASAARGLPHSCHPTPASKLPATGPAARRPVCAVS
jgi:hypothetical protein